jgi:hypothetical protein
MDYTDLDKIWNSVLMKLGYREGKPGCWIAETQELVIILSHKVNAREKDMYLDIGILFKKLHTYNSIYELKFEDHDIGQGLWTFLVYMGEWEYYLNNLFLYDPAINSATEVNNNIRELAMLFLVKVIPHIEDLDYFARQAKDFEEEYTWYPFLQYFRANEDHNEHFAGILYEFHVQQYRERKKKDRF